MGRNRGARAESVPLRSPRENRAGGAPRGRGTARCRGERRLEPRQGRLMGAPGMKVSRRAVLSTGGALVVSFALAPSLAAAAARSSGEAADRSLPGSLRSTPMLDSWLRIDARGIRAAPRSLLGNPAHRRVMGRSWPRVDIPAKVFGESAFVQDLRLAGMVHARVVHPPSYGARLRSFETAPILRRSRAATGRAIPSCGFQPCRSRWRWWC